MINAHIPPYFFSPRPPELAGRSPKPVHQSEPVEKIHSHIPQEDHSDARSGPKVIVADIMERDIIAVPPTLRLEQLARLFVEKKVSGFPVVDSRRELLGLVSQKDLLNSVVEHQVERDKEFYTSLYMEFDQNFGVLPGACVQDIMTPFVYYATPETDIREVIDLMLKNSIHRVVVTKDRKLKGLVSSSQLLRVLRDLL